MSAAQPLKSDSRLQMGQIELKLNRTVFGLVGIEDLDKIIHQVAVGMDPERAPK